MTLAPFDADQQFLGAFLRENKLRVPELQRPFAWGPAEAQELVNDLLIIMDESGDVKPRHFFGTVVLLNDNHSRLSVIDGQQRLTTTTLALGLIEQSIRNVAREARGEGSIAAKEIAQRAEQIADNLHTYLWFDGAPGPDLQVVEELRLSVSPEILTTYRRLVSGQDPENRPMLTGPDKSLRAVARTLRDELIDPPSSKQLDFTERVQRLWRVAQTITVGLLVVWVRTGSASAGYDLFESLNARGKPLNVLDLVKVWILANMPPELEGKAAQATRHLQTGEGEDPIRYFTDYFRIRVLAHPDRRDAKRFSLDARRRLFTPANDPDGTPTEPIEEHILGELRLMERLHPIWKELQDAKVPAKLGGDATLRSVASHRQQLLIKTLKHGAGGSGGLIWSLLLDAVDAADHLDDYVKFVHGVERFFFRFKVISAKPIGPMESAYFEIMRRNRRDGRLDVTSALRLLQEVLDQHSPETAFIASASEKLTYTGGASIARIRYALYLLDTYQTKLASQPVPTDCYDLATTQIEHIAPRSPLHPHGLSDGAVNSFGNLCLLDEAMNPHLSNKGFTEKCKKVADLGQGPHPRRIKFVLSRDVFEQGNSTTWGEEEITARWEELSQRLVEACRLA